MPNAPAPSHQADPGAQATPARGALPRILVVGQTPPPYGGQAINTKRLLDGRYERMRLFHVRLAFSTEMDEIGKFKAKKLARLAGTIGRIVEGRVRHGAEVLYYMPAGPDRLPLYRDFAILLSTRWMFRSTVFHFRAGGLSELYPRLSRVERALFHLAFERPDLTIRLAPMAPPDDEEMHPLRRVVIPNGIDDEYPRFAQGGRGARAPDAEPVLLFMGILRESKGPLVFLEACGLLRARGRRFRARVVGKFESPEFERLFRERVEALELSDRVECPGVLLGDAKWQAFRDADVFCLPTFFESEALSGVVLEAMQFELPVVSTRWRGIPLLVDEGESGFLVPVRDAEAVADRLDQLLGDPALRARMGRRGRERYLEGFTVERFRRDMEAALSSL